MAFIHGKQTRVFLSEYEISSYFNQASMDAAVDTAETSVFNDDDKQYIPGMSGGTLSLSGFFEAETDINPLAATTETLDEVLEGMVSDGNTELVTYVIGTPAAGSRARVMAGAITGYNIQSPVGGVTATTLNVQNNAVTPRSGFLLSNMASVTTTPALGTTVDSGITVATTNGWVAALHVFGNTRNGTVIVKVQHSTNGSTWADLVTFSTVSSATLGYQVLQSSTDTVNRYLRQQVTLGGSTGGVNIAAVLCRR